MATECNRESFVFQPLVRREVVGRFDGGKIASDAGAAGWHGQRCGRCVPLLCEQCHSVAVRGRYGPRSRGHA